MDLRGAASYRFERHAPKGFQVPSHTANCCIWIMYLDGLNDTLVSMGCLFSDIFHEIPSLSEELLVNSRHEGLHK